MSSETSKSIGKGLLAAVLLLVLYASIVSFVSGWQFMLEQFAAYWYFVTSLAVGFGIQFGLYTYVKGMVRAGGEKGVVAVTGTTSTAAMISCCAHYLANILPIVGIAGIASFVGQYQVELFWVGLAFNVFGIFYIGRRVYVFSKARI